MCACVCVCARGWGVFWGGFHGRSCAVQLPVLPQPHKKVPLCTFSTSCPPPLRLGDKGGRGASPPGRGGRGGDTAQPLCQVGNTVILVSPPPCSLACAWPCRVGTFPFVTLAVDNKRGVSVGASCGVPWGGKRAANPSPVLLAVEKEGKIPQEKSPPSSRMLDVHQEGDGKPLPKGHRHQNSPEATSPQPWGHFSSMGGTGRLALICPGILKAYGKLFPIRLLRKRSHYGEIRNWLRDGNQEQE